LLGMERRQAEQIRDLARGQFLGLGPAISRRPVAVRIGPVKTGAKVVMQKLAPPPTSQPDELHALLHADLHLDQAAPADPAPVVHLPPADELIERIAGHAIEAEDLAPPASAPVLSQEEVDAAISRILTDMAAEEGSTFQPQSKLFQDFTVRCRMQRLTAGRFDMNQFRRRFAMAVAGVTDEGSEAWRDILRVAAPLADDLLAPFLVIARAALDGLPCPADEELARIYGTNSLGRIRRLLDHYERCGLIVVRNDFSGRRSVSIPELGLATEPLEA